MNEKLKPCPFCGSEAEHISKPNIEVISCTMCEMGRAYDGSASALIVMWKHGLFHSNKRSIAMEKENLSKLGISSMFFEMYGWPIEWDTWTDREQEIYIRGVYESVQFNGKYEES